MTTKLNDGTSVYGLCSECHAKIEYRQEFNSRIFPLENEFVFSGYLLATAKVKEGETHPRYIKIHILTCSKECLIKRLRSIKIEDLEVE